MGKKRDAILEALENLTPEELKKFKLKLGAAPLREGFRNIPRGALGQLDAVDLTDKLIAFYCEDYGAELTAVVLRDMGMQEEAARLQGVA
ncbi:pyrin domain-containing protein 1-like [Artibeus jamaicensis]|uniref:pyrin domain-containing protein 1 n=1 Tax=Artibeus jamaicensis TaxID=9417 RepID=UPI00235A9FFE|nr:pyrin domain-containing protein 1 [Artibeus jamaicensis]XP_053527665.1 pyrin domain-containing protein 1-like [Artibeus jamaicensis]